jgi:hypothetical protein
MVVTSGHKIKRFYLPKAKTGMPLSRSKLAKTAQSPISTIVAPQAPLESGKETENADNQCRQGDYLSSKVNRDRYQLE